MSQEGTRLVFKWSLGKKRTWDLWEASSTGALCRGLGRSAHLPSHLAVAGLKRSHEAAAVGALREGAAYLAASHSLPGLCLVI